MAATKAQNGSGVPAAGERPSTSTPAGSAAAAGPGAGATTAPRVIVAGDKGRILCVADIRGDYHELNKLIRENEATAVIHVGDFGFMEAESVPRMSDKIIRHILQYSPLLPPTMRTHLLSLPSTGPNARQSLVEALNNSSLHFPLSQFPHLLSGAITFPVPVFTVYGLIEDVRVLEKFRTGEYEVHNLHVIDEVGTSCLETGGVRLRLFGLGGAMAMHKLFDCGEGSSTIAGAQGTMWSTALQIGELLETAQKVYDPSETRIFIASSAVGRNGIFSQICRAIKADLTISAGLHFRYTVSFNEHSVCTDFAEYQAKLVSANSDLSGVYSSVREKVDATMTEYQHGLLRKVLDMAGDIPDRESEEKERSMTNIWHWSLSDTSCGQMLLALGEGRLSSEVKSTGLNFSHRLAHTQAPPTAPLHTAAAQLSISGKPPTDSSTATQSGPPPIGPAGARGAPGQSMAPSPGPGGLARPPQGGPGPHAPFANGVRPNLARPPPAGRPGAPGASASPGPNVPAGPMAGGASGFPRQPQNPAGPGFGRPARPPMGGPAGSNAQAPTGPGGPGSQGLGQHQRGPMPAGPGANPRPPRPNGSQLGFNMSSTNSQLLRPNAANQYSNQPQNQNQNQNQSQGLGKAPASVPSKPGTPSKGAGGVGAKEKPEGNKTETKNAAPASGGKKEDAKPSTPVPAGASKEPKDQAAHTSAATTAAAATGSEDKPDTTSGAATAANQESQAPAPRTKWSLFIRGLPVPVSEQELRDAFGESKSKIQSVKLVFDRFAGSKSNKQKDIAYVDFATEDDMNEALKVEVKIKDTTITPVVSNPPARPARDDSSRGFRGGPRGGMRGGRGGGRGGAPGIGRKDSEGGEKKEAAAAPVAAPAAGGDATA